MPSLRDKLRAAAPIKQAAIKPPPEDCMIKEALYPLADFALPGILGGDTLAVAAGGEFEDIWRDQLLFLDTETTGLSGGVGTVAFLVGVSRFTKDGLLVRQYLMRDYDEECLMLRHVLDELNDCKLLVTFNGVTFDMPLLESRLTMQRLRGDYQAPRHIDLLHIARRVWKLRLKNCSLQNLEKEILGIEREDDLPGALVPERYFCYLKSHDMALLDDILEHNEQDVVSMAHLLHRALSMHLTPLECAQFEDIYSIGRVYERRGRANEARMCYRAADQGAVSALARFRLAESYRKAGDWAAAREVYERMAQSEQGGVETYVALAKVYEHRLRDYGRAMNCTRRAMILAVEHGGDLKALQRRYERLNEKSGRTKENGLHGRDQGQNGAC